jgi:hypothetical protein
MIIPENVNFERIKFNQSNKIEKLVNYLKRKKEKHRLGNVKLNSVEEIGEILNSDKNIFGAQIKENSFIIWKFTLNWKYM